MTRFLRGNSVVATAEVVQRKLLVDVYWDIPVELGRLSLQSSAKAEHLWLRTGEKTHLAFYLEAKFDSVGMKRLLPTSFVNANVLRNKG
ncbi:MAG: hypothetical protein KME32_00755 [Mojavia pulchra JT2-VF2]|jgi:hypothetical protein|uniref:Uncharacterized protein n=1 Tax=Mojavia pulchra JT2-VF2 TaxID=287848 RepID=A0A951PVB2_9NOST|nr:hypothetical protein [Mojavia pulchra JT2-VF2]